jgi:hypothetical protein
VNWLPREEIVSPVSEAEREAVRTAQRALQLPETGEMCEATRAALRGLQHLVSLPVTGTLNRATADALGRLRNPSIKE